MKLKGTRKQEALKDCIANECILGKTRALLLEAF